MEPFVPNAPGQVVEYDFWGPVFGMYLFLGFYDMCTGILKMRMVKAAGALVVVHGIMTTWAPDQGFPLELVADIGKGCKNSVTEIFYTICGITGLYASPRRHQAIGGIENAWRRMNMAARAINLKLDGALVDINEREKACRDMMILSRYNLIN